MIVWHRVATYILAVTKLIFLRSDAYSLRFSFVASLIWMTAISGCDGGLAPPDVKPVGSISGSISYSGAWPSADSLQDLRFVAMRFVPVDTSDFLQLNQMEISPTLQFNVVSDSFLIQDVIPGPFFYSGVAQQFAEDLLAWRPVGLVNENGGLFEVTPGTRTHVTVHVDFSTLPPFPPAPR